MSLTISGIEITAPIKEEYENSLNFFVDKRIIRGYGWIFPIGGGMGHVGIGGLASGSGLNNALRSFLNRLEIPFSRNGLVGGAIPCTGLGDPVEDGKYFVGDSARQALPLSAEGIRTSLYFSRMCADAIMAVERGKLSPAEGLRFYGKKVMETRYAFGALALIQAAYLALPQVFFDSCVFFATMKPLRNPLLRSYLSIARL
ncbi:MAG: hypothetical protein AB1529_00865 [Candidatus Micrarchaeota archaeon]